MSSAIEALLDGAGAVIRGKRDFLELLISALLAGGHVLLEDNPGLGKTTVAKAIAGLIGGRGAADRDTANEAANIDATNIEENDAADEKLIFKRIQFTPDLLPYDITGVDIFDPESHSFRFVPGPVLANIVLADEINRTTPKVQSALLEVMAEKQVTIGTASHRPPEPFFVIATQNPIESEGTFPLPAAQLDRFMLKLSLGYPDREAEIAILSDNPSGAILSDLQPVISAQEFIALSKTAATVFCHPAIKEAIVDIVRQTRVHKAFLLGASPRAALHYLAAARAYALVKGRDFVSDADLAALAYPALAHRVKFRDVKADGQKIIKEICLARIEDIRIEGIRTA